MADGGAVAPGPGPGGDPRPAAAHRPAPRGPGSSPAWSCPAWCSTTRSSTTPRGLLPGLGWTIYGYGLPCVGFWYAAHRFRAHGDAALVRFSRGGVRSRSASLLVSLQIRFWTAGRHRGPRPTPSSSAACRPSRGSPSPTASIFVPTGSARDTFGWGWRVLGVVAAVAVGAAADTRWAAVAPDRGRRPSRGQPPAARLRPAGPVRGAVLPGRGHAAFRRRPPRRHLRRHRGARADLHRGVARGAPRLPRKHPDLRVGRRRIPRRRPRPRTRSGTRTPWRG